MAYDAQVQVVDTKDEVINYQQMSIDKLNTTIVTLKSLTSEYTATSVRSSPDKAQEKSRGTFNNNNGVVVNGLLVSIDIQRMTTPENIWKTQAISHYTAEEISEAKRELWRICGETFIGKMIRRQGSSKTKAELDDISVALNTLSEHDILPTFVASSSMLRHSLLLNENTSNNSNDVILNRLSILEDSINALNINREATKPAGTATDTLSNSIDNSNDQRSSEELWSSVLLKNIPAAGVCPVAESEDVFTSTQNRSSHGTTSNENNGSALAAEIDIVAYGVAKNVRATQLATFLESKGLKVVDCVLLTTYEQARSLTYKITIKAKDFEKSQDPATWPYRISFRPFINRRVKITR